MKIKIRHVKTIYWLRSLRNTHTRKHSRNPGGDSSQAPNKQLNVKTRSELHASPHIHIWIGHNHIWIYMDKTIWDCALYMWASMKFLPKTKRKPWPCMMVIKLNFITIAWNFGLLEYSSSHSRGIKAKIRPRKNYKINLFKFPVLHTRCFTEWWSVVAL